MRDLILWSMFVLALFSCQNNSAPNTGEAVQTTEMAGKDTAQAVANKPEEHPIPVDSNVGRSSGPKGIITGSNVTMRKEASVQSEKLGSFESTESVEVLETKNVNNEREAILSKPITVKGSGGEVGLTKGKAVVIEEYQSEHNVYRVTYQDPQKGKLSAEVDASAVETITYSTWYKVKRTNGETGWVLGKFLKIN